MGMRVTTGMAMNTYRYNLQNSTANVDKSRNTVLSHRKFTSYAEAPAAATQAWRVRRAMVNNDIYKTNNADTYTRFNIAWNALGQASYDLTNLDGKSSDLRATNDPTASGRPALGLVLDQTAESVVQTMNSAKSGENFLFAGDDELYAPFSWDGDKLLYRGVDVNSGGVPSPDAKPAWCDSEINIETGFPKNMPNKVTNPIDQKWVDYYKELAVYQKDPANGTEPVEPKLEPMPSTLDATKMTAKEVDDYGVPKIAYEIVKNIENPDEKGDVSYTASDGVTKLAATKAEQEWAIYLVDQGNLTKLKEMSKEEVQIDLGMGMLEDDNGKLIDGTYYNRALPGVNMLGFGVDEDGDPKNVCMILKRLGEIFQNCNPDTGSYDSTDTEGKTEKAKAIQAEAVRLLDKLKAGQENVSNQYVEVSAKASFLTQNEDRLKLQGDMLDEQRVEIENVDLAQAISQFSWDYYCYSAALKVGTQLLSQSLIDYMT